MNERFEDYVILVLGWVACFFGAVASIGAIGFFLEHSARRGVIQLLIGLATIAIAGTVVHRVRKRMKYRREANRPPEESSPPESD